MSYPDGGKEQLQDNAVQDKDLNSNLCVYAFLSLLAYIEISRNLSLGQPLHFTTWQRNCVKAFIREGKMSSKTDVDGYLKASNPKTKTIASELLEKVEKLPNLKNLSERICIDENNHVVILEQATRDGIDSVHDILKQLIFPPDVDYRRLKKYTLPRDLSDFLFTVKSFEQWLQRGLDWSRSFQWYSPYLWTEDDKIKFMQKTEEFTVRKHPSLADAYNKSFIEQFGCQWKSMIPEKAIMNQVLKYQPKVKPYEGPADAVRLWSNGFKHYEQYLPFKERGITDAEKALRISEEFPDVVQKTWRSVMTLLTVEGYLNKPQRNEFLQMLGWREADFEFGGIGFLIATSFAKLEADAASRTRRSVQSVSNSAPGSVSASRGTSEVPMDGLSFKAALMAPRRGG